MKYQYCAICKKFGNYKVLYKGNFNKEQVDEKIFSARRTPDRLHYRLVKCKKCGNVERADHILEDILKENFEGLSPAELSELMKKHKIKCSKCKGLLEEVGTLNMLFPLSVGAENPQQAYLRGETAKEFM